MATLTQSPAPVPTGSDIPTYSQVPETAFGRKWFTGKSRSQSNRPIMPMVTERNLDISVIF